MFLATRKQPDNPTLHGKPVLNTAIWMDRQVALPTRPTLDEQVDDLCARNGIMRYEWYQNPAHSQLP